MPALCDHAPSTVEGSVRFLIFAAVGLILYSMSTFASVQNMTAQEKQALVARREAMERESVVAHTAIHHSAQYRSAITLTVVPKSLPLGPK